MYEWVLEQRKAGKIEFQYDLNPQRFDKQEDSLFKIMFSKTLRVFYGAILTADVIVILYFLFPNFLELICKCVK